jgi:hypothetical protein
VERDFSAFYQRQSTKILNLSKGCRDPGLKNQLVEIAATWLKSPQGDSAALAVGHGFSVVNDGGLAARLHGRSLRARSSRRCL